MSRVKKKLKCLCNDDRMCPSYDVVPGEKRQCTTESVCLTKRYRRMDSENEEYFKYFCDDAFSNSIRDDVIQYRDCMVNTTNIIDSKFVVENSAEYCCDSEDFCNEYLKPKKSVISNEAFDGPNIEPGSTNVDQSTIFTTLNIAFLSLFGLFILCMIIILVVFFVRRKQKQKSLKHKKTPLSLSTSSGSSTTSSEKSKLTTRSALTTATSVAAEKSDHILVGLSQQPIYQPKISNQNLVNHAPQLDSKSNRVNQYLHCTNPGIVSAAELLEPLIETKTVTKPLVYKENSLTLGSDFCTTTSGSDSYTTTSGSTSSSNCQNQNIYSMQSTSNATNSNGFEWSGSGSGAGVPQLLQRTIARQIKLIYPCIGKGRFGEVYKGMWRDEFIAVKTFNSADEKSWENECSIYNTSGFRHENILGFIASDNIDRGTYTELWIITEFHQNGSLYDYLNQPNLKQTPADTLRMALSIVNGLDHLHTPIESCTGKPALAHCDLKSKNILVKADLTCCIGDLGLALCGDKNGNVTQNPATIRTGTKRYMAPEILAKTINYKSLLQFQNAEMYSLALIFWELLRRTSFDLEQPLNNNNSTTQSASDQIPTRRVHYSYDYKLPYYEHIQSDPDEFQMKQMVCDQKKRPEINSLWRQVPILSELTQLTEELWVENADGRLNALRLKKSLNLIKRRQQQQN